MTKSTMMYAMDNLGGYHGEFDGEHVLCSAGTAWNNPGDGFRLAVPDNPETLFVDSGGFQVTAGWNLIYPTLGGRTSTGRSLSTRTTSLCQMRRASRLSTPRSLSTACTTQYFGNTKPIRTISMATTPSTSCRFSRVGRRETIGSVPGGWNHRGLSPTTPQSGPSVSDVGQTPSATCFRCWSKSGQTPSGTSSGRHSGCGKTTVFGAGSGRPILRRGIGARHRLRRRRNCTMSINRRWRTPTATSLRRYYER